jgi:hypothetical protein
MWWVVYIAICVFGALVFSDWRVRICMIYSGAALIVMRAPEFVDFGQFRWIFYGAVWASVSAACRRHSVSFSGLTLVSGMCYLWGRIGEYEIAPGSAPLVVADLAWLFAVMVLWGPAIGQIIFMDRSKRLSFDTDGNQRNSFDVGRGLHVGRGHDRRGNPPHANLDRSAP